MRRKGGTQSGKLFLYSPFFSSFRFSVGVEISSSVFNSPLRERDVFYMFPGTAGSVKA
jgi:hypothetical protein